VPFYQAQAIVYGQAFVNTILAALKTVPGGALVASAKLRLSNQVGFNPTKDATIAGLAANECNYSGYTAGGIAVVLTAPVDLSATVQGVMFTALFEAVAASPFVPDTGRGWWIDDGTNFIAGEAFAGGFVAPFAAPGNFVNLTAILPLPFAQSTS
jgi:hypothetical protein